MPSSSPIPSISESLVSQAGEGKISDRWYRWLRDMAVSFNPAAYLPITGGTVTGSVNISTGTNLPLTLTTSSAGPYALEITRSDIGNTIRVYNDAGLWHFDATVYSNGGLDTPASVNCNNLLINTTGASIQGPNSTSIYMSFSGDNQMYFEADAGIVFTVGGISRGWLNSSGDFTAGNSLTAANGVFWGASGRQVITDFGDGWLRINQIGSFSNGTYTPNVIAADGGFTNSNRGFFLQINNSNLTYGSAYLTGGASGYVGLALNDGGARYPTFMTNGSESGVYNQSPGYWSWADTGSEFCVNNPVMQGNGAGNNAYLRHVSGYTSGQVTVSTSAPSGGSSGDIWLQYF